MITDEWFSYSARGELTDVYQSTPHSGGYYHSTASYYPNGALQNLSPGIGGGQLTLPWTYGVDSEGRTILNQNTKYNVASQLTNVVSSTGDNDVYTYDPNTGRMTQYQSNIGTAPMQITGALQWNPNGTLQKLTITDGFTPSTSQTCLYSYDDLARLGSVNCTNPSSQNVWNQNFSYDAYGNVTKIIPTGGTGIAWNPGYPANNQYASGSGAQYDADGNLLNDTFNQYTWNSDGKVASIKPLPSGNTTTITYDALGREVEFGVTTFTQVMYAPTGKIALMNGQTEINAFQPLLGGGVLVHRPGSLTNYWRHGDWLGSSRLASTTPGRTKFFDTAYAPFGENYLSAGTTDLDFTGEDQDTATNSGGLYDFLLREYAPRQGRWISPDPAGLKAVNPSNPQSWNRYTYVINSPENRVDPSGTCDLIAGGFKQTYGAEDTQVQQGLADLADANLAFPFSGLGLSGSLFGAYGQTAADVLKNAITDTVQQSNGGATNLILYSGSAGVYASIYPSLPAEVQNGITSVTYVSPGVAPLQAGGLPGVESVSTPDPNSLTGTYSYNSNIVSGTSAFDAFITGPLNGVNFNCGHNANCLFSNIYLKLAKRSSRGCPKRKLFDRNNKAGKSLPNFFGVNGLVLGWDPFDILNIQTRPTGNF